MEKTKKSPKGLVRRVSALEFESEWRGAVLRAILALELGKGNGPALRAELLAAYEALGASVEEAADGER